MDTLIFTVGERTHEIGTSAFWERLHGDVPWHETPCVCGWVLCYGSETRVSPVGFSAGAHAALKCESCHASYPGTLAPNLTVPLLSPAALPSSRPPSPYAGADAATLNRYRWSLWDALFLATQRGAPVEVGEWLGSELCRVRALAGTAAA